MNVYNKYLKILIILPFLFSCTSKKPAVVQKRKHEIATVIPNVFTGIDMLKRGQFKDLENKRVGLITNPTGVDYTMKSTIDILFEAKNVNLVALFGPEHGVRGNIHAGDKIDTSIDEKTGLPIHSLYGATRKPTREMLQGIDVLVYDIQDIGCRSFTYISTMGLAMEAAAENNIEFIVLDRPNPLGGEKIEGNIVTDGFYSFVSQYPIPYIYGLTCGELALYLNGENILKGKPCKLRVIPMQGWRRSMTYKETGLQWIPSSPHIPLAETAPFYPASGIVGELGVLSIGVGYTLPFHLFGAEWIDAEKLASNLNELMLPGVHFRPIHYKPFYSFGKGEQLQGVQFHITDYKNVALTEIQFYVIQELNKLYPKHKVFKQAKKERIKMFDKVCGSDKVRKLFSKHYQFEDAKSYWNKDVEKFRKASSKYYLYQ